MSNCFVSVSRVVSRRNKQWCINPAATWLKDKIEKVRIRQTKCVKNQSRKGIRPSYRAEFTRLKNENCFKLKFCQAARSSISFNLETTEV